MIESLRSLPALAIELARLNRNLAELIEILNDMRTMSADALGWKVKETARDED